MCLVYNAECQHRHSEEEEQSELYAKEAANTEVIEVDGKSRWSVCCEDHQLCARRFPPAYQG